MIGPLIRVIYCLQCGSWCFISPQMWKSVVGHNVSMKVAAEGDDWETDPDFEVLCTLCGVCVVVQTLLSQPFLTLCFRMTCQSRSRGGEQRPSRARGVKSTSGTTSASGNERWFFKRCKEMQVRVGAAQQQEEEVRAQAVRLQVSPNMGNI